MSLFRPQRGFSRVLVVLLSALFLVAGAGGGYVLYAYSKYRAIPKFESQKIHLPNGSAAPQVSLAPTEAGKPETFLLFSTGSSGLTAAEAQKLGIGGGRENDPDGLTDVVMLVVIDPQTKKAAALSLPRDIWVSKYHSKLNALDKIYGAEVFKEEVESLTSIKVNHMVSLNFTAFQQITDAVGGVSIYVPQELRDPQASLLVTQTGCVHFDGATALAYVRSRHTQVLTPSGWKLDPATSDFGRIKSQHVFLDAILNKVLGPQLVTQLPSLLDAADKNVVIDQNLSLSDMRKLASAFSSSSSSALETYTYPTTTGMVGSADVDFAQTKEAQPIIAHLEGGLGAPLASPSASGSASPSSSASGSPAATDTPTPDVSSHSCSQ